MLEKLLSHQNYKNLNDKLIKSTYYTIQELVNVLLINPYILFLTVFLHYKLITLQLTNFLYKFF